MLKFTYLLASFAFVAFAFVEIFLGHDSLAFILMVSAVLSCMRLDRIERNERRAKDWARFESMMDRKFRSY